MALIMMMLSLVSLGFASIYKIWQFYLLLIDLLRLLSTKSGKKAECWTLAQILLGTVITVLVQPSAFVTQHISSWYGSGRETVAVLLPGFAINW